MLTRVSFFLHSTPWIPDFPGFPTPNSGLHYVYLFGSFLTHQLWNHHKNGNFPLFIQPGVLPLSILHRLPQITQPEDFDLSEVTETVEGLSLQHVNLTLQCGVKYPCHILTLFLIKTQMTLVTLCSFLTWTATSESYLCSLVLPRKGGGVAYKAIFCLFYIPEDPPAGFPTLPSLYYFFGVSLKIMAVMKQLSFTNNLLCARPCAGSRIYILSCDPLSNCQR